MSTQQACGDPDPLRDAITRQKDLASITPVKTQSSALDQQVGGNHYKDCAIQPVEFIHANGIGYFEGNVIKYVSRWRKKGGIADLEKAKHYLELLIDLEGKKANKDTLAKFAEDTTVAVGSSGLSHQFHPMTWPCPVESCDCQKLNMEHSEWITHMINRHGLSPRQASVQWGKSKPAPPNTSP